MKLVFIFQLSVCSLIYSQSVEVKDALEYYPLHVGDYWQYKVERRGADIRPDTTWIGYKEVIGDTLMPNGNRYYLAREEKLPPASMYFRPDCIRIDSATAIIYNYYSPEDYEYPIDSLLAQKGDTLLRYVERCYICTEDTIKRYFNLDVETRRVERYCLSQTAYDGWELAKGFGEVMRSYDDVYFLWIHYQCDLIYAKIDGREFGTRSIMEEMTLLPNHFHLFQNYPNPFNAETEISYYLPIKSYIKLSILDLRGREVAVLVNHEQSPGEYQMHFDATDLNSGIYTYRLFSNEISVSKKMLLLK